MGIQIKNPLIIASSPLTESEDAIGKCELYGAGAVIAKSCSSTRLQKKGYRRCLIDKSGWWAASTYDREIQYVDDAIKYLSKAVKNTSIPIFSSVSELTLDPDIWLRTCRLVQDSGVAGIQLDLFYFENIMGEVDFKERFIELLYELRKAITIPIFPKLNINMPSIYMAEIFEISNIKNVSLLDSISLPAPISLDKGGLPKMRHSLNIQKASLFGAWQYPLTKKYLYDLKVRGISVCAGGGVQKSDDIIELILLGAQAVQVATVIILMGYKKINEFVCDIEDYMRKNNIIRIQDMQGISIPSSIGETIYRDMTVVYNKELCIDCNKCLMQCFCTAIKRVGCDIVIDKDLCEGCSLCVDMCSTKALNCE